MNNKKQMIYGIIFSIIVLVLLFTMEKEWVFPYIIGWLVGGKTLLHAIQWRYDEWDRRIKDV